MPHNIAVLIPAYKPDKRFVTLVAELAALQYPVYVVDDGGGEKYQHIFTEASNLGATVLTHETNHGKGRAIKTGLAALQSTNYAGVITADADGQHTAADIEKVEQAMLRNPNAFVIGARGFTGDVPFKSRAGNAITRVVYYMATHIYCSDTQTGLRGLPRSMWTHMAAIDGERYEYEMNALMYAKNYNWELSEVSIKTIYLNNNEGSHFNPLRDALRIYGTIARFAGSSIASFITDYAAYLLLGFLGLPVWLAYGLARVASGVVNYTLNRVFVFGKDGGERQAAKYAALWFCQMVFCAAVTHGLSLIGGVSRYLIKILVDLAVFFVSYIIQRKFVFVKRVKE